MSEFTVLHHQQTTLAIDPADGMVNASLLVRRFSGRNPVEYLMLDGTQPTLASIAENNGKPLTSHWQDGRLRSSRRPEFLRELTAAGIMRQKPGTVDGHKAAAPGVAGNGVRDFVPGLWIHADLAAGLARWAECRGESWRPSPLAEFVEQVLAEQTAGKASSPKGAPESAAESFAGMVNAATLQNLRAMDQLMIDGGLSFTERQQTLHARLEQKAQQRGKV
ncbi:MAG: KilA-N domain-containing protein [Pseudomonas sp.]|nr:KilA-N domain-containing protein [Pseudomonas sp.]MDZ4192612.1 KilA-N domain-containing protein [Pseudomonas sp.]